jgi:glycosyltransferase involved in cell wall biosynthesis
MDILLAGPYPYQNQKISGGVESVLYNLNEGFLKYDKKEKIDLLSASSSSKSPQEKIKNIYYIKQPKFKLGSVFLSLYPKRLKNFYSKNSYDIINAHEIEFAYYGLKKNKNLIFTLHGFPWIEGKFLPKFKQPFWKFFYLKKLDHVFRDLKFFISINDHGKNLIKKKTNATIFDIQNPVDDGFFNIKSNSEQKRFLYVGSISRMKNLFLLIKSLNSIKNQIKDFKLNVAGQSIDKNYFSEINSFIKKNKLQKNINFLGLIDKKEKFKEFSKMDFLIIPSLNEHAPMVISEAFASGKTVIASNVGGIPFMVNDGKNGLLFDPMKEKDLSEKILYLINNYNQKKQMQINAKKYAKKFNSQSSVIRKYKSAFKEIII